MSLGPAADVAVVIVNYDTGSWLARCLDSLERRRGSVKTEIIVVDNASRDGSERAAERSGVQLVRNPTNVFLSPAWNQGARLTEAPFLLFLNPDTEWFSGTVEDLVAVGRSHPRAGIVGPMIRDPAGVVYPSGRTFPSVLDAAGHAFLAPFSRANPFTRRYEMDGWDRTTERSVDWVSGCCMLIPREAFDAVGGFDEAFPLYAEELDVATRLHDAGWSVVFTPEVEVLHQIGVSTGGVRRPHRLVVMHSTSMYRYYAKHRAGGWRRLTLPLAWMVLRSRAEIAWLAGRLIRR
ncbi:MAG: glycosyltransferase family 2 protein [Actinomycetota bacterium]